MRAAIGSRDQEYRNPQRPELPRLDGGTECHARHLAISCRQRVRAFVGSRFAKQQQTDRQSHQQGQQRDNRKHRAPAVIRNRPHRQIGHDQRRHTRTDQHDAQSKPAVPDEPHADRAAPGDRRRSDPDEPDQEPQRIIARQRRRREIHRRKRDGETHKRQQGNAAHAIFVGQPANNRRHQRRRNAEDGNPGADLTPVPAEFILQRLEQGTQDIEGQRRRAAHHAQKSGNENFPTLAELGQPPRLSLELVLGAHDPLCGRVQISIVCQCRLRIALVETIAAFRRQGPAIIRPFECQPSIDDPCWCTV